MSTAEMAAPMSDSLLELRVLGPLWARSPDGRPIPIEAWRTRKTRDLLRLLALRAGESVPVEKVLEAIWPDVTPDKGRASLRTASYTIRRLLGPERLRREADALSLCGVWVDALAFRTAAAAAEQRFRRQELAQGLVLARTALALYRGALGTDDPYSEWAGPDREQLEGLHAEVVLHAAEACCELGCHTDGAELAQQCIALERHTERAHRVLMRALWAQGESEEALRAYDRCRLTLVEELGADPAPETEALHLRILNRESPPQRAVQLVGREDQLATVLDEGSRAMSSGQALFALVSVPPRCGATSFLGEVCRQWNGPVHQVSAGDGIPAAVSPSSLVVIDGIDRFRADVLQWAISILATRDDVVVVATASRTAPGRDLGPLLNRMVSGKRAIVVYLEPLVRSELVALVERLLGMAPTPELVDLLEEVSGGRPADAVEHLRGALAHGHLVFTENGVARLDQVVAPNTAHPPDTELGVAHLSVEARVVLEVASLLTEPFGLGVVGAAVNDDETAIRGLDELEDLKILVRQRDAYRFADGRLRQSTRDWLRPARRRELHLAIADHAPLSTAERIDHLLQGGAAHEARTAASAAGRMAFRRQDMAQARQWFRRAIELSTPATVQDDLRDLKMLVLACHRLGLYAEGTDAVERAMGAAADAGTAEVAELHCLRALLELGQEAADETVRWCDETVEIDGCEPITRCTAAVVRGAAVALSAPRRSEAQLRQAAALAACTNSPALQAVSLALLGASALSLERRGAEGATLTDEAIALAEESHDDALLAWVLRVAREPVALLGGYPWLLADLDRARAAAQRASFVRLVDDVTALLCAVTHALGCARFHQLWPLRSGRGDEGNVPARSAWEWVAVRALHDRGEVEEAYALAWRCRDLTRPFVRQAPLALASAAAFAELGLLEEARGNLQWIVSEGMASGALLLVPEAAARLALLETPHDPVAAEGHLATAEQVLGAQWHPRERAAILLARAALATQDRGPAAAEPLAAAAAREACAAGHVFPHVEALEYLAQYRFQDGHGLEARRAWNKAAALYRAVGAPRRAERCRELMGGACEDGAPTLASAGRW